MFIEYTYSKLEEKMPRPPLVNEKLKLDLKNGGLIEVSNDKYKLYWRGVCSVVEQVMGTRPKGFSTINLDLDRYGSVKVEEFTINSDLKIPNEKLVTIEFSNNKLNISYIPPKGSKDLRPQNIQRNEGVTTETLKNLQALCDACAWNYTVTIVEGISGIELIFLDKNKNKPIDENKLSPFDYAIKKLIETSYVLGSNLLFVLFDASGVDKFWVKKFLTELSKFTTILMVYNFKQDLNGAKISC